MIYSCFILFCLEDVATLLHDCGIRPCYLVRNWCLFGLIVFNGRYPFLRLLNKLHPILLQFFNRSLVYLSHTFLLLVARIDVLGDCLGFLKDVGLTLFVLDLMAVDGNGRLFKRVCFFWRTLHAFLLAQLGGAHFIYIRGYFDHIIVVVVGHARCL